MSLDGFIAGPGHAMDWGNGRALADFVAPKDLAEVAAATGAMLVGRRTWEVGDRMEAEEPGSVDYQRSRATRPSSASGSASSPTDSARSPSPGDTCLI